MCIRDSIYSNDKSINTVNLNASGTVSSSGANIADVTIANGSITSASTNIDFGNNGIVTTSEITGSAINTGTLSVTDGSIQDSDGSISFGYTIISTSGNITAIGDITGDKVTGSELAVSGTSLLSGDVTISNKANIGNLSLTSNSIQSSGGSIDFNDENLSTTGTFNTGSTDITGTAKVSTTLRVRTTVTAGDITISNGSISSTGL